VSIRHNTNTNPCLGVSDAGWNDGAATIVRTAVTGFTRPFAGRASVANAAFMRTSRGVATPSVSNAASMSVRPTNTVSGSIYIEWIDASNAVITYNSVPFTNIPGGVVTRLGLAAVAPANAAFMRIILDGINYGTNPTDFSEVLFEASASVGSYFDGDSDDSTWDGTPGLSASTFDDVNRFGATTLTLGLAVGSTGASVRSGATGIALGLAMSSIGSPGGAPFSQVLCSSWALVADLSTEQRAALVSLTDNQVNTYLLRASEILWALSGRRWYGQGCTETATLRSHPPQPGQGTWPYHRMWGACACWGSGVVLDGRLFPGFADYRGEHIASPMAVKLPRSRVNSIVSVTIDGNPFAAYRMLQSGWVERTDGQGWRMCDDSTVIVYTYGEAPPAGGRDAAIALGVELAKAAIGDKTCRLPQRVTSVTRQGLSFSQIDPFTFLDKGRTGLLVVDMWLASVNPEARPQAAGVWSPDIPGTIRS
jgi:hypothetical protein